MITYDGLRVLMMAEDDSRCCFGLFGPLFQPNIMKIRQGACFFIARLMVMLPDVEIPLKSRKITKNNFLRNLFFSSLAKSRHTSGIKSCASPDGFNAVLDRF